MLAKDERLRVELISIKAHSTGNKTSFHPHILAPSLLDRRTVLVIEESVDATRIIMPGLVEGKFVSLFDSSSSFCSVLFYILLFLLYRSVANSWNLCRIDTGEWPSTLGSTYPVDESKLLKHQIADGCHDRRGGGGLSGLSTLHDS